MINTEYLLGLVNVWQFGSLTLLADDWDTVRISLSDLVGLGLSLLYTQKENSKLTNTVNKSNSRIDFHWVLVFRMSLMSKMFPIPKNIG